jgi:hypothetical protein
MDVPQSDEQESVGGAESDLEPEPVLLEEAPDSSDDDEVPPPADLDTASPRKDAPPPATPARRALSKADAEEEQFRYG